MNLRNAILGCVLLGGLGWWYSTRGPDPSYAATASQGCPLPPATGRLQAPLQTPVPAGMLAFASAGATLTPLAGFSVDARVLARQDYRLGREADLSPIDLALGWARMREPAVLSQLHITQSSRWYHYRWDSQPPLPVSDIARSSANMHMIPANAEVAAALASVRQGDEVRIEGWLVDAHTGDQWRWRSSTTREDNGAGACELVYVCAIRRQ